MTSQLGQVVYKPQAAYSRLVELLVRTLPRIETTAMLNVSARTRNGQKLCSS